MRELERYKSHYSHTQDKIVPVSADVMLTPQSSSYSVNNEDFNQLLGDFASIKLDSPQYQQYKEEEYKKIMEELNYPFEYEDPEQALGQITGTNTPQPATTGAVDGNEFDIIYTFSIFISCHVTTDYIITFLSLLTLFLITSE